MTKRNRWILHLDIDAFFAAVEVILNPSLKGKPVVVGGLPKERGVVATASYEARKFGVYSGMPLTKAYQLCPNCIFIRGSYSKYSEISKIFFKTLYKFTPDLEMASLDEAYLDLSRCSLIYSSIEDSAKLIKEEAEKATGLSISGGLGSNKFIAKIATEEAKPGGFVYVEQGREMDFLKDISIEKIPGIGAEAFEILKMTGIEKIGDIWNLSKKDLCLILGPIGEDVYFLARGIEEREVVSFRYPKSISRETTFPEDIWEDELILAHFSYLSDRLSETLRSSNLSAYTIEIKVRFSDFSTFTRRKSLSIPTNDMFEIYKISRQLFLQNFSSRKLAIRLVGVKASELTAGNTNSIFEAEKRKKREELFKAIDRVREKYGFTKLIIGKEKILEKIYKKEDERGFILKTSCLTK
ncbi:MAG: DNA polymerase IV [Candidatus Aminicenantia bacterium]